MGRKTDVLLKGFRAAKCLTLLKVATARIKVVKNKRSMSAKQMRGEIAQLIKSGQDAHVYITKADALIKQENMVAVYDLLDQYCHAVMSRFPAIEMQRHCPADMKEPIASIIYAAPRCIELTELPAIKEAFVAKFGKEFAAAASELRPDCGVSTQIIELLSIRPATGDMKLKLMKEICIEHSVDWTPGEALAGPAVATGGAEVKVEPMQAIGTLGSIKANAGVGEPGPSKTAPLQGASKHGASNKVGLAEAMVTGKAGGEGFFSLNAKTSDKKQSSASQGDASKGKSSVSETPKAPDASEVDNASLSSFEEEDARRLHARILQSLKGGSFVDFEGEAVKTAEVSVITMDAQDGMSDSDSDSFVSVEEGRFEDDLEPFLDKAASRKESFRENPNSGLADAGLHRPSLSKKLSDSSQQDIYSRASGKNSGAAMEMHEGMPASSLPVKSSHEDMFLRASSEKSSNAEQVLEKDSRKDSLNMGKLVEAQSVEELKEDRVINEHEDMFVRVSSKNSSNVEEVTEKVSRKDSLNMTKPFEAQSGEKLNVDMMMDEKVAEDFSIEASDKEGLQMKDFLKVKSDEATTESPPTQNLSEKQFSKARKTAEELSDEDCLQGEGIIEVTASVASTGLCLEEKHFEESSLDANKRLCVAEEKPKLPSLNMSRDHSGSERMFDEEVSSAAGEETCLSNEELPEHVCNNASKKFGEEPLPSSKNGGVSGSLPALGMSVEELVGASSLSALATLENTQDFAAAAKAIAAEAARLAVLDYAKRMAESGSIPFNLSELSKFDVAFEENKGGPRGKKTSLRKGKSESTDSGYAGDSKSHEKDAIEEEESLKEGTSLNDDEVHKNDHLDVDEMIANIEKVKPPVADDAIDGDNGNLNASITAEDKLRLQEMVTEIEDINPFSINIDKDTDALFSKIDDEKVSWVGMAQPGQTSKVGNYGRDDDHLDIFFTRKTPWMSEKPPMFDEDRYSFLKPKSSCIEEKTPYGGFEKKKSSLQDDLFSKPLFYSVAEGQSTASKETSNSFKSPVFDEGEGGSFKIPIFDEGSEPYDAAFSSDDGLDKSNLSGKVSEKRGAQFPPNIKSPASFDLKSEPCFDKVASEDEVPNKGRTELPSKGQLKWQAKKPSASVRHVVTGDGVSGSPMSRRSRRQPKSYNDSEYGGDSSSQLTSRRKSLLQQQGNEPDAKDEDNFREKKALGPNLVQPYVYSSSAMSQRPSDPPKWVASQVDYDPLVEDELDSTSTQIPSIRTTESPTRLVNRQRLRNEDYYFHEENDLASSSAGTSKTTKSPTRMAKQQPMTHGYVDDPAGYKINFNNSRIPSLYQHDMAEDDYTEEFQGRYKPSSPTSDLNRRTSAGSGISDGRQQQRRQQEEPGMRSEYKQYREDVGESPRTRPMASRQQQKKYIKEEEPYLVSRYKPTFRNDEPLHYESGKNLRIPELYKLEMDEDEDNAQQLRPQEELDMGSKYKHYREDGRESPRAKPMPNRRQHKKYIEEEEPHLVSRYKQPVIQDDEPLDYRSNNKSRTPKLYHLEKDVDEHNEQQHRQHEEPGMGFEYKQYREDGVESSRTRPMSSRLQQKKNIEEEEPYLVSRYKPMIQDDEPLDYASKSSRTPKVDQLKKHADENDEDQRAQYMHPTQMDDPGRRASLSSGADRRHEQRYQQEEDALDSGYIHNEEAPSREERILTSRLSAGPMPLDFEEEPYLLSGYKLSKQLDNQVKSSPLRPLSSRQQEKKRIDEVESASRYHTPTATDDDLLHRHEEEEEEERRGPRIPSQHKERPQQEQQWSTLSDDYEIDSQFKRENPGSQRKEQFKKDKEQEVSGRWQKQSMPSEGEVHGGREKQHLRPPSYQNNQEELHSFVEPHELQQGKQRHKSIPLPEGQQEQVAQVIKPSLSPSYSRKQDSLCEESLSKSGQQELEQKGGGMRKERQRPQEEGVNEQQQKTEIKETRAEEERANGQQVNPGIKSHLATQQPPQSTSSPLESSISDPIVLATIPPPTKKSVTPSASILVKLESSASAPSSSQPLELRVPKVPQKPPNLNDLAANFEALRRARKGE